MSGTVTLTAAMRANLLSLQQTGAQLSTTQLDLATGNKVNSALDNPVNFFAAQSLNTRAASLSSLLDGMGQGVTAIQTANEGITSITAMVNQLTSIVNSANQDLANQSTQNVMTTSGSSGISSALVHNLVTANAVVGDTLDITDANGASEGVTLSAAETLSQFVAQINTSSQFTATVTYGNGTSTSPNGGATEAVGSAYLSIVANDGSQVFTANDVHNLGTLGGIENELGLDNTTFTVGTSSAVSTGGSVGDNNNYQAVLLQINALAANSKYQSTNLVNGAGAAQNMVIQVNELSTTPITVTAVNSTATGLGLTGTSVTSAATVTVATAAIQAALATLQTQAASFAQTLSILQTRQDFTSNLVNTLQNGSSLLTIADKNQEGANLLALQTQQQLGIEALSLTSQSNQSVLRLFA